MKMKQSLNAVFESSCICLGSYWIFFIDWEICRCRCWHGGRRTLPKWLEITKRRDKVELNHLKMSGSWRRLKKFCSLIGLSLMFKYLITRKIKGKILSFYSIKHRRSLFISNFNKFWWFFLTFFFVDVDADMEDNKLSQSKVIGIRKKRQIGAISTGK